MQTRVASTWTYFWEHYSTAANCQLRISRNDSDWKMLKCQSFYARHYRSITRRHWIDGPVWICTIPAHVSRVLRLAILRGILSAYTTPSPPPVSNSNISALSMRSREAGEAFIFRHLLPTASVCETLCGCVRQDYKRNALVTLAFPTIYSAHKRVPHTPLRFRQHVVVFRQWWLMECLCVRIVRCHSRECLMECCPFIFWKSFVFLVWL